MCACAFQCFYLSESQFEFLDLQNEDIFVTSGGPDLASAPARRLGHVFFFFVVFFYVTVKIRIRLREEKRCRAFFYEFLQGLGIVCLSWECRKELTGEERWETRGMRCNRRPWACGADGWEWMSKTQQVCVPERGIHWLIDLRKKSDILKWRKEGTPSGQLECPLSFYRCVKISRDIPQRPRRSCWSISFSSSLTMAPCVLYESLSNLSCFFSHSFRFSP